MEQSVLLKMFPDSRLNLDVLKTLIKQLSKTSNYINLCSYVYILLTSTSSLHQ